MTRLFLAAGVAALAIAAPTAAKPGGGQGGPHGGQQQAQNQGGPRGGAQAQRGGGGQHVQGQRMEHGGGGQRMQAQRVEHGGGGQRMQAQRMERGGGFSAPQMQRQERQAARQLRVEHQQPRQQQLRADRGQQAQSRRIERQQPRADRMQQVQNQRIERDQLRSNRVEQAQNRGFGRQQIRTDRMDRQQRALAREQFRNPRFEQAQNAITRDRADRLRVNNDYAARYYSANRRGLIDGCPPGLWAKNNGCMPPGQAQKLLGAPLASVAGYTALNAFPTRLAYLYPDTQDYYYRYGDGYLYQVDRGTNLIANLLPLMAGGYLPGQYLPQPYMASYVPNNYGFNSFYPDYGNDCNRYANGVVYEVDCYTGMIQDVIPLYAGGYGVGQVLPASYAYYNVPYQYRTMYYDTPDYNYWYAPGAIYQYDPGTSMITSVAALLSPGFAVGQALPVGYDAYNVPYSYRQTYYDTPNAWYRYNNGNIYQVDPATRLVTAIVASLLT